MALAIADTNTYSGGNASSHNVSLPANIAAGDLLLVFFAANGAPTVTDPSGWTALVSKVNTDTYRVYARIADGSEGSTVTVGLSASQTSTGVSYRITGARNGVTTSEISVSSAVDANTATPDPPSLTPSWGSAENLWIAVTYSQDGSFTFSSYPTNYSLGQFNVQNGSGTGNAISVAARLLTATSEDPGTFSTVTSRNRSTYTLAIRPATVTNKTLPADPGSYSLTGTDATVKVGRKVAAATGGYALTGTNAGLKRGLKVAAASGGYSISGQVTVLRIARKLIASAGTYAQTGTNAGLKYGRKVAAAPGAYNLTGTDAGLSKAGNKLLAADPGSYALTGTAAVLRHAWRLAAAAGGYSLTGTNAGLKRGRKVGAAAGSYALTGVNAGLIRTRRVTAGVGAYTLNGSSAALRHSWKLAAATGGYLFAGFDVSLIHVVPPVIHGPGRARVSATGAIAGVTAQSAASRVGVAPNSARVVGSSAKARVSASSINSRVTVN